MADKIPEDVAYTITTGYYPQIASSVKFRHKPGKGGTGKKYIKKAGFSDVSVERHEAKQMKDVLMMIAGGANQGMPIQPDVESAILGTGHERKTGTKQDPKKVWYKFRGGSDQYKLYGDMVWHMHGSRGDTNIFTDYINSKNFGNKHPQFGNIYSRMEPKLVAMAANLAEEIFQISVDEIEKELKASEGTDAAEEIGFSDGEFTYMSHDEAMNQYPDQADKIKKQSMSRANPRDMVIVKDGVIVGTRDVTEMPLTGEGQHGITKVPQELKDAIKEVRGDGRKTAALRQAVISMFTNAIDKDYNPVIQSIKDYAGFGGQAGDKLGGDWDKVLKGVKEQSKKTGGKGSNSVTTTMLGSAAGIEMAKLGLGDTHKKTTGQTSVEYIAHMLGTLNLSTNDNFKQSHLVFEHDNGQGVYANVPMVTDPNTLLFKTGPVGGTSITSGYNATMAMSTKAGHMKRENTRELSKTQKHAYSMSKVTGVTASSTGHAVATANMGVAKGARPSTVVTIPAVDKLEEALLEEMKNGIPDIRKRLGVGGSKLQERMYGLGNRRKAMRTGEDPNKTQFWALPYIGVLGSDYLGEKKK